MAAGLVPLLVLAAWRPTVASAQVIKSDWSRVQATLLHGSSRKMSYHWFFQRWG